MLSVEAAMGDGGVSKEAGPPPINQWLAQKKRSDRLPPGRCFLPSGEHTLQRHVSIAYQQLHRNGM